MPDGSVFEAPFCTMNTIHRERIEKKVAKKAGEKVMQEFDTSKGQRVLPEQDLAHNGGTKKEE
jgi:uncharacterized radical SAM superfamily Fe-S cluster-containing enzyme